MVNVCTVVLLAIEKMPGIHKTMVVSKVDKKIDSHFIWIEHILSVVATVQDFETFMLESFSSSLDQNCVTLRESFCAFHFEVLKSVIRCSVFCI